MRIAWFSSAERYSKASQFSRRVLPRLLSSHDIELFVDSPNIGDFEKVFSSARLHTGRRIHPAQIFPLRNSHEPFDIVFHQVESLPEAGQMRIWQGLYPGFTFFHEFLLSNYGPDPILASPWRDTARSFLAGDTSFNFDRHQDYELGTTLALREACLSFYPMFPNERERNLFLNSTASPLHPSASKLKASDTLPFPAKSSESFEEDGILILGGSEPHFFNDVLLRAIRSKGGSSRAIYWYVEESDFAQSSSLAEEVFGDSWEKRISLEVLSEESFAKGLRRSEVAFALSLSTFANFEPQLSDVLCAHTEVAVLDFGSFSFLPDEYVLKFKPDWTLKEQLEEYFSLRSACARSSRERELKAEFFFEAHNPELIGAELEKIFEREFEAFSTFRNSWQGFQETARREVLSESGFEPAQLEEVFSAGFEEVFFELGWRDEENLQ